MRRLRYCDGARAATSARCIMACGIRLPNQNPMFWGWAGGLRAREFSFEARSRSTGPISSFLQGTWGPRQLSVALQPSAEPKLAFAAPWDKPWLILHSDRNICTRELYPASFNYIEGLVKSDNVSFIDRKLAYSPLKECNPRSQRTDATFWKGRINPGRLASYVFNGAEPNSGLNRPQWNRTRISNRERNRVWV
jgi:hypothetical protein